MDSLRADTRCLGAPSTAGGSVLSRDQQHSKPQLFTSHMCKRPAGLGYPVTVDSGDTDDGAWSLRGREILLE